MSTVIENQIVQTSFDNKEFEKNISTSMKSLDKFKESMDFEESTRSFKDLEKASESIDFDKLNKAVDGIGDHFSLVGRVFYKVTDEIANYFTSKITGAINAVKSITTDMIDVKAGYKKYDDYTHGVKNILAALSDDNLAALENQYGAAITGVESKLSELMAYTDETSYNFTDMVGTIGKFLGAGIGLDSAVADMQGIANWAALSGQDAATASQAMYQMSQALGAGYVKYQDWAQMANLKSMGTTAAKDVFIEAAIAAGTITQKDIAEAKKVIKEQGGNVDNWRNWFFESKQLNDQQWLKTEVLEKGLQTFSSVSNEVIPLVNNLNEESDLTVTRFVRMGNEMKKTGKSAKEMVDQMMAEGKIDLVGEDYDKVVASLQKLTSEEYKVGWNALKAAQEATTFQEALDATKDAVGTQFLKIFNALIGNYEEAAALWTDFANNMYDLFAQPLADVGEALGEWSKESSGIFDQYGNELTKRQALWAGLSKTIGGLLSVFGKLIKTLTGATGPLADNVVGIFDRLVYGLDSLGDILNGIAESNTVRTLGFVIRDLYEILAALFGGVMQVVKAFLGFNHSVDNVDIGLAGIAWGIKSVTSTLKVLINSLLGSKGFKFALDIIAKTMNIVYYAFGTVGNAITAFSDLVREVVMLIFGPFNSSMGNISANFYDLGESLASLAERILTTFGVSEDVAKDVYRKISNFFFDLGDVIHGFFDDTLYPLKAELKDMFTSAPNAFEGAANVILAILGGLVVESINLLGKIFGFDATAVTNKLISAAEYVEEAFGGWMQRSHTQFRKLWSDLTTEDTETIKILWNNLAQSFMHDEGPKKVESVLTFIHHMLKMGVERIIDAVGALFGVDLHSFKMLVLGFMDSFAEATAKLQPGFEEAWYAIKDVFSDLADIFKIIGNAILDLIGKAAGIEDMDSAKFIDILGGLLKRLAGFLVWVINGIGKLAIAAAPYVKALAEFLKQGLGGLWLAIKAFVGKDDSPEALKALSNMKKVLFDVLVVFLIIKSIMFAKRIGGIAKDLGALAGLLPGGKEESAMSVITKFITRLAILMFALAILANQDIAGLAMGIITMSVMMNLILKGLKKMLELLAEFAMDAKENDFDDKTLQKQIKRITKLLGKIASLILIISISVAIMAKASDMYGADVVSKVMINLTTILGTIIIGLGFVIKSASQLDAKSKQLKKVGKLITKITIALLIIAIAFGALAGYISLIEAANPNGRAIETAMMIMAAGVIALMGTSFLIAEAGGKLSARKFAKAARNLMKIAVAMLAVPVAMAMLFLAIDKTGLVDTLSSLKIDLKALAVGVVVLAGVVTALCLVIKPDMAKKIRKTAKTVTKVMISLSVVVGAIAGMAIMLTMTVNRIATLTTSLESVDILEAIIALGKTLILLAAVTLMFKIISFLKVDAKAIGNIFKIALAINLLAVAMGILAATLIALSLFKITEDSIKGMLAVLVVVAGLIALSALFGAMNISLKTLSKLSLALLEMGAGIFILALALAVLSKVDAESITTAAIAIGVLLAILLGFTVLLALIPGAVAVLQAVANAILKFAIALAILAGVMLVFALLDTFAEDITNALYSLNEKLPEMVEALVTVLATLLVALANSLTDHAEEIGEALGQLVIAILEIVLVLLMKLWEDFLVPMLQAVAEWFEDVWESICEGFQSVVDFFKGVGKAILNFFVGLWEGICDFFGIASPSKKFAELGLNILEGLWNGIKSAAEWIWDLVIGVFKSIWNGIVAVFSTIFEFGSDLLHKIWDGISAGFSAVSSFIKNVFEKIWGFITAPFKAVYTLGKDIVEGLWNGINDMVEWVCKKIEGFCGKALGAIKKFFGISSPSKVMAEMGNYMMEGLGIGLDQGEGGVLNKVVSIASDVLGGFTGMSNIPVGFDTSSIGGIGDLSVDNLSLDGIDYGDSLAFDPSAMGLSSVYSMDVVPNYNSMGGMDIPTNFQPTIKDSQLEQITDAETTGTQDIVDAIHEMRDELTRQAEIISKYQMVLDSGVLVGELVAPMDKALGNRAKLATGRGV